MIYLVAPDPSSFISGGNRFNQQILDGLKSLQCPHQRIDIWEATSRIGEKSNTLIFDSIYLKELQPPYLDQCKARKIFLIHFLPSMLDGGSWTEFRLLNSFDRIIANSVFTLDYCQKTVGLKNEIILVQPFIESFRVTPVPASKHNIIHVANWIPSKQIHLLLKELSLYDLPANLSVDFYGDPARDAGYYQLCKNLLDTHSTLKEHIHIHGSLSFEHLKNVYEHAALFIDTSLMETYGMAVAEALVNGVPVLSLGNGNCINLIRGKNGMACRDMKELVDHLILFTRGNLSFSLPDTTQIITEWDKFIAQLEAIQDLTI